MQSLWRDFAFGIRMLLRRPGFTAAALASLVLGIGLNTAIFTLLDAIFLRPLPVEDLDSLAAIYSSRRNDAGEYEGAHSVSRPNFLDLVERSRSFSGTAMYLWGPMNLSGGSEPVRAIGTFASASYFEVLGVRPRAGRFFLPGEDVEGGEAVAVLGHGCWSRLFGARPEVVGEQVEINGRRFAVVGVAPRGFRGTEIGVDVDVWLPLAKFAELSPYAEWYDVRPARLFRAFGRLREGVTVEQAGAELMRLSRQLEEEFPVDNEGLGAVVKPLLEGTLRPSERPRHLGYGRILLVAVTLILLMSCLNVASLLLARGLERGREIAIRQSLGASRRRTVAQLVSENLLLFLIGGALSLPVARWSLDLLWRFRPPQFAAEALDLSLDATIFAFALAVALATGVVFGLVPALRATRLDLVSHLKEAGSGATEGTVRHWLQPRRLLVIGQVALALIALVGAGLFLRSLRNAQEIDLGFDVEPLLVLTFAPGEQGWDEARTRAFYERVLERVEALPGVRSAALSENRLLRGAIQQIGIYIEGQDPLFVGAGRDSHRSNAVFPGFFETVGIPLVAGRDFDDSMRADSPAVAIVNETMARLAWPGTDAVGQRFRIGYRDRPPIEVVGVARDAKYRYVHEAPQCFVYLPEAQRHASAMTLHVRTEGDPARLLATVRREVHALAPELPLADLGTLADFVAEALWIERVSAAMLSAFGGLALALATLGVYGVLRQAVNGRRRELGVRMAVGARGPDVLRLIVGEGLKLVGLGLALGLVAALAVMKLTSSLSRQLHGVSVTDPGIYAAAAAVLLAAAFVGFLAPAAQAARTDPARTLRAE